MLTRSWPGLAFVAELEVRGRERKVGVWALADGGAPETLSERADGRHGA